MKARYNNLCMDAIVYKKLIYNILKPVLIYLTFLFFHKLKYYTFV